MSFSHGHSSIGDGVVGFDDESRNALRDGRGGRGPAVGAGMGTAGNDATGPTSASTRGFSSSARGTSQLLVESGFNLLC